MMHHPNMHHQPMSGHPPQHLPGHQAMPAHHQIPPHQMHRENRHVTLTRVALGPSGAGGGMGAHGQMGGIGAMGVHHAQRPPHPVRPMHHPPAHHHSVPPQQGRPMRRPYSGGGYGPSGPGAMPYAHPPPMQPPPATQSPHTVVTSVNSTSPNGTSEPQSEEGAGGSTSGATSGAEESAAAGDSEAPRLPAAPANSKEKTPMCLVNELARYNKIKHQYRLTSETGPAHKKVFTVTLRLGDTEEYTAEGSSIKRAQHAAASAALSGTRFPPPPPRPSPALAPPHAHQRHQGAVMPTVELNALAMKLCQPAVYTSVPPVAGGRVRARLPPPYRLHAPFVPHYPHPHPHPHPHAHPRLIEPAPNLLYRVRVCVGGRAWLGEGVTPQAARHDAAARALQDLRPAADLAPHAAPAAASASASASASPTNGAEQDNGDGSADLLNSEVKSPVSLVHELALKRNLNVQFSVKSERGPPHMRVFVTVCTVGEMETEGEGNGKKVSKRRAAERMVEEMRRRWPPALLRARPALDRRRHAPAKKKPRNLIKEGAAATGGGGGGACGAAGGAASDNPISRLAVARHAARARSPQYRVLEERGAARRREFLVQCDAPPHSATGLGPNKKTAKRRAAHNVLLAMEMANGGEVTLTANGDVSAGAGDASTNGGDSKRKEGGGLTSGTSVGGGGGGCGAGGAGEVRQPVPGVLMMDYHQREGRSLPHHQPLGVSASECSATGASGGGGGSGAGLGGAGGVGGTGGVGSTGGAGNTAAGGNSPGAKDQLMYLSQLLGFTVQFSDFPKRNHGEYLSLVSLSTEPPVMCHGGGASTAHSHEQCARAALRALALMGLDAPSPPGMQSMPGPGAKTNVISNGISE